MTRTPYRLDNYFFTELSIKAQLPEDPDSIEEFSATVDPDELDISLNSSPGNEENQLYISLTVSSIDGEGVGRFYAFNMSGMATVSLAEELPDSFPEDEELWKELVSVNGANIVYAAMRDRLEVATGSMPWGRVFLPPVFTRSLLNAD